MESLFLNRASYVLKYFDFKLDPAMDKSALGAIVFAILFTAAIVLLLR